MLRNGVRILIAPRWTRSHVVASLPLACALRELGHEVHVQALAADCALVADYGCVPLEMPVGDLLDGFYRSTSVDQFTQANTAFARRIAGDLVRQLGALRIDLAITGTLTVGAALAAEKVGLPWASLATCPYELHPGMLAYGTAKVPVDELRRELDLPPRPGHAIDQARSPALHLLCWTPEFDVGVLPPQCVHIGPLVTDDRALAAPPWLAELGDGPLVLVAGTTVPIGNAAGRMRRLLETAVRALEELGVAGVVTPGGFDVELRPRAANIRIAPYVAHGLIIDRASAVVAHGGWGTVSRAMQHGVPTLNGPLFFDQPFNAEAVQRLGLGRALDVDALEVGALAQMLREVIDRDAPEQRAAAAYRDTLRELTARRAAERVLALASA
jgi:UDP:flavonoid glycosyltransferase YjiC (YdhE family)